MSGVFFVPMESIGNYDPNRVYEELMLHYSTLQGRKIAPMSCECSKKNCSVVMPFVSQIALPVISGIGQAILVTSLPSPLQEIEPVVNKDLAFSMLSYLIETKTGRQFALELGYKNVKEITLDRFRRFGVISLVGDPWCGYSGIHFFYMDNILPELGGYSLLSSSIASFLNTCAPFVINRLMPTTFPNGHYHEAQTLLKRTDNLMKRAAGQLTSEQKSNLKNSQKSLTRLKNRNWVVLGVSGAIFLADLGMKCYLVYLGLQQIRSITNPQNLYQPGLPDFCWFDSRNCSAALLPNITDAECAQSYPADFINYAKENTALHSSQFDFGAWKVWTVVMLPLVGRVLENIPLLYRTTKEAIQRCRCPKGKRASLLDDLQEI